MSRNNRRNGSTPRLVRNFALAAAIVLSAVALSQCRMVQDNLTGVRAGAGRLSARSTCTKLCNSAFEAAMRAEEARHRDALRACDHDSDCRQAESVRHLVNVGQIDEARKNCKRACYNEGAGGGA